jgi:Ca2+:H+ antiporter
MMAASFFGIGLPRLEPPEEKSDPFKRMKELRDIALDAIGSQGEPQYPLLVNAPILLISLPSIIFTTIYVLEAMPSQSFKMSKSFIGLVVMPMIIASIEHISAILRSSKENIDWIVEAALGSSIRLSLFVFPLAVVIGWGLGVTDMSMILDGFQVTILGLTIILVNYIMNNGVFHS